MKAKLTKATFGINAKHRKEKLFTNASTLLAINGGEIRELMTVRWYWTNARCYCCLWIHNDANLTGASGSGFVGGGGYHKTSAAMQKALDSAGIELDIHIDGCGDSAIESALHAIGEAMKALELARASNADVLALDTMTLDRCASSFIANQPCSIPRWKFKAALERVKSKIGVK
jgi:hypothetical protein